MTIYAQVVTTEVTNAKDAYAKVQAYRTLFNISHNDLLTHVRGVFYDVDNNLVFLDQYLHLVTITARSIRWIDPTTGDETRITPTTFDDSFELTIRV